MSDLFKTISSPGEGIVREKMSRFLSFAIPVRTADEAKGIIKEYQNRYHDSRHVCWAYMLGPRRSVWQANDNGEPSGTAGKPILGQINSFGLTDIIIIVVRYFGGIKLGTSGLIAAYRQAAREAIENTDIIEKHDTRLIEIRFPYLAMNDVMKLCKQSGTDIVKQQFDNSCLMTIEVRRDNVERILHSICDIDGVDAEVAEQQGGRGRITDLHQKCAT